MKNLPFWVGFIFSLVHLLLVILAVYNIFYGGEPDWPMIWLIFLAIDFPFSLIIFIFAPHSSNYLIFHHGFLMHSPLNDFNNFVLPVIFFGMGGTIWWFLVGFVLSKVIINVSKLLKCKLKRIGYKR